MSNPGISESPRVARPPAGAVSAPRSLPDVNAEIYPYDVVQHLLDQTANFNMFAVPDPDYAQTASLTDDTNDWFGLNGGYGIAVRSEIHHFDVLVQPPSTGSGVRVAQTVGRAAGSFRSRWFLGAGEVAWTPEQLPQPVLFDRWASQRFAMVDTEVELGQGEGFRGYGTGRTYPVSVNGRPRLLVGGVGNVTEGRGKFAGLEGTYVLAGTLTPELGFLGNITCRIVDPEGRMRDGREVPSVSALANPDPESTFFVLRGVKKNRHVKTTYGPPPDDRRVSLVTPSQMRSVQYLFASREHGGPRTEMRVGQVVGPMEATVFFDLLSPPGTAERPVPFTTEELYTFEDGDGRTVGTITAGITEGVSFSLRFPAAPGQPGVRFAGFGPITGGTGPFAGVQGLLTVNSLIGISPHALSLMHVLHVVDPDGRFRAGGRGSR